MSAPSALAQGRALLRMTLRGAVNSLRHRQGAGALVVFPLLLTVLLIELARFGGKGADGVRRFVVAAPPDRAGHFVALWLSVMAVAVVALKYARAIPGRGAPALFDTLLFRALPVSPVTRTVFELLVGSTHAAGFVALAFAPALYGLVTLRVTGAHAVLLTAIVAVALNAIATLVAHALHALLSRYLGGRGLDLVRVVTACTGFLLVGLFSTAGPIGVAFARRLRVGRPVPAWSEALPLHGLVRWLHFDDPRGLTHLPPPAPFSRRCAVLWRPLWRRPRAPRARGRRLWGHAPRGRRGAAQPRLWRRRARERGAFRPQAFFCQPPFSPCCQ